MFWARLTQSLKGKELRPQDALANFEATFGKPDKIAEVKGELSSFWILLKLDPRLPEARRATILKQLDVSFTPTPTQVDDFGLTDLRSRTRLLTPISAARSFPDIVQGQGRQHADRPHGHGPRADRPQPQAQ